MICTNIASDVTINPIIDNEYIMGTNIDPIDPQFIWYFKPKKQGNTFIRASFKYLGVPVGDDFSQEVKIQSTGYSVEGTDLEFKFIPDLDSAIHGEKVLIQIIDNKTGSLVPEPRLFVDAIEVNGTETFEFIFESGKEYEFRALAPGYYNNVKIFSLPDNSIVISINPTSGGISTYFNISTSIENATLKINNVDYPNPYYGTLSAGLLQLEASTDGYNNGYLNLTVTDYIRATKIGEVEFKKGEVQNFTLTGNISSWVVYFQKDLESQMEELIRGYGNDVSFNPKKSGVYTLNADGANVQNGVFQIEGFSFGDKFWFMPVWGWLIASVVLFILVILIILKVRSGDGSSPGFRSAPINYE